LLLIAGGAEFRFSLTMLAFITCATILDHSQKIIEIAGRLAFLGSDGQSDQENR
jgi:hypothetical protein